MGRYKSFESNSGGQLRSLAICRKEGRGVLSNSMTFIAFQLSGLAFYVGFCWLIYTNLTVQHVTKTDNYPKRIAYVINLLLPEDIDTVYELGFNRILNVTSYIETHVKQLDNFSQLRTIDGGKNKIYFIFDTKFPDRLSDNERKFFIQEMQWRKIYTKKMHDRDYEIVVGYIN